MVLPTAQGLASTQGRLSQDAHTGSGQKEKAVVPISIFWRLVLGSLAIIVVMAGANLYGLSQLRQLTAASTQQVSYHFPAIDTGKRLVQSLYAQLLNEKRFLAVRDRGFLRRFEDELEAFRRTLVLLQQQELSDEGRGYLADVQKLHTQYVDLFTTQAVRRDAQLAKTEADYEQERDDLVEGMEQRLDRYVAYHEMRVAEGVNEAQARAVQAEAVTDRLVVVTLLLSLALAAIGSYSILRPLRRLQQHIRKIGQGHFGKSVQVEVPSDLRELVDTVNWMGGRLQELDNMKADFLAHVSHELRSPLASIREGTQLLLDGIPGPVTRTQRDTLEIMSQSSRRLIHLISTLLDLSKMEAGMMEYRFAPTDLRRLAEQSIDKIRLLAASRHVQLILEAPAGPLMASVDAGRIEQVLDNLLSNAVKFSPDGMAVTLSIEHDPGDRFVHVGVSDSGPGIAPEDVPHIFERFYQGRRQGSKTTAGSGIGLALAKKVVEAHKGRIWVESEVGKGATFRFVLLLRGGGR